MKALAAKLLASIRRRPVLWAAAAALALILFGFRYFVPSDPGETRLDRSRDGKVLVVIIRGLAGRRPTAGLEAFVRQTFPQADLLTSTYEPSPFANIDPYRLADTIEHGIHDAYGERRYERIVLVGYSMGAMVLRKALVWGHGLEEDREHLGVQGKRQWVDRVERFVSIAGVNRGWTIDPKPENMSGHVFVAYYLAEKLARLTGTGKLLLGMQRGSPFIADLRVQWIRLARDPAVERGERRLPLVVHLLGDVDDIVAREDSQDLAAAKDTRFITLKNTDHENVVAGLMDPSRPQAAYRARVIRAALTRPAAELPFDRQAALREDLGVRRIVYILHGIRDYGLWGEEIQRAIEQAAPVGGDTVVIPSKYGYFPMLPFLLYGDRQENVRWFMDEYTQNLAQFPRARRFDFIGHSNGTYILASALQRYHTLRVDDVFFAGSVVPQRYPWRDLAAAGRVARVRNVVASGDWVVALFPQLFEHLAKWLGVRSTRSFLDIGSAGFRGFRDAADPTGRIRDVKFVAGGHGAGVDVSRQAKLAGIVGYALHGDDRGLRSFRETSTPSTVLDLLSNVAWIVWLGLIAGLFYAGRFASRFGWKGLALYLVVVLGILYSF